MEKKSKKSLKESAKERRKKFENQVDMNYYYTCRGKIRPTYLPHSHNFERKKITCSVCKIKSYSGVLKEDSCWYCNDCEKYSSATNKERRQLRLFQNPNKKDFDNIYELKQCLLFLLRNWKQFLIKKLSLISHVWGSIQQVVQAGAQQLRQKKK
jgi:hypothetical protein